MKLMMLIRTLQNPMFYTDDSQLYVHFKSSSADSTKQSL